MARVDTLSEAKVLAQAIKDGQVPEDRMEEAMGALTTFSGEQDARDEFSRTRLRADPQEGPSVNTHVPQAFSSEKARKNFIDNSPAVKQINAAAMGVNVKDGIDPKIRATVGLLNFNPNTAAFVMDEMIRTSIPEGEVPKGTPYVANIAGVPSALTRQKDGSYRYHALDPVGFDSGDFAEFAGELPQIGAEVAGTLAGGIAGAPAGPATALGLGTLGAAAGSQFGLEARVAIARMAGVPEDMLQEAITTDVRLREALLSTVGDLGTAAVLGVTRGFRNFKGGRVLTAEQVEEARPEVEKALRLAGEFRDKTGQELELGMAQLTGNADFAVAEATLKQNSNGSAAQMLKARDLKQQEATNRALNEMTEGKTRLPPDSVRLIEDVTADVQTGVRGASEQARRTQEVAEEDLDTFVNSMDKQMSPDSFIATRDGAYEAADAARKESVSAWDQFRKEVEWGPGSGSKIHIESGAGSPIKKALIELDTESGRALLASTAKSKQAFLKDAGMPEAVPHGGDQSTGQPTSGLAAEFLDPRELHFTLSDLKRRQRHASKGVDPDGFRAEDMRRLVDAIEETIENQPMHRASNGKLVSPEKTARVRESFKVANDTTRVMHSLYDSDNMRALLKTKTRKDAAGAVTTELRMPAGMIYKRMFKEGDGTFLSDALDAVGNNPAIKAQLAEELFKKHRNLTKTDASMDAHRKFVDDHRDHMRLLGMDPDVIRGAGGLAHAARQAKKAADDLIKRISLTFGAPLSHEATDALNIHELMVKGGPAKTRNIITYLEQTDATLASEVRDASLREMRRDLSTKGDTSLNFDKLWQTVETQGSTLAAIHGEQYVKDLTLLKDIERILQRGRANAVPHGAASQPWILQLSRSLLGPLSKKQRFLTAAQRAKKRLQGNAMKAVISSPEDMRKFIKLTTLTPQEAIKRMMADNVLRFLLPDDVNEDIAQGAASLNELPATQQDNLRRKAGSSLVPGRPSPAEAVGGKQPGQSDLGGDVEERNRSGAYSTPQMAGPSVLHDKAADAAQAAGVPVEIFQALVQAESSFRPKAKAGTTNASGLTQMTPAAAKDVGMDWDARFDPDTSLKGGADYLKLQIDKFEDIELALLAYHDGATNVKRYQAGTADPRTKYGGAGLAYVKKIMKSVGETPTIDRLITGSV